MAIKKKDFKEVRSKKKNSGKATGIIIALIILLIVVGSILIYMLLRDGDNSIDGETPPVETPGTVSGGRGIVATPENIEEIISGMGEPVQDGYYVTKMNLEWLFDRWDVPSKNAYVENSIDNTRTVYFDLFIDYTEELVYSSPFIPVGSKLEGITIDKELPEGEYAATVTYHLVDDDYNDLTDVSVAVKLKILS